MAKATVLACDKCGKWDSAENPVRRVTVAGPKFELCAEDRAVLLVELGVPVDVAVQYQAMINDKVGKTGALPPLSAAVKVALEKEGLAAESGNSLTDRANAVQVAAGDPNGDPDQTDILTALADREKDRELVTAHGESSPVSEDPYQRLADATAEISAGLRPADLAPKRMATLEQDPNETPPKSVRRRK